jgi:TM2 domain-containing membrane protein YozV
MRRCSSCGARAYSARSKWCSKCGRPLYGESAISAASSQPQVVIIRQSKNPGIAAVLSAVWCGLGQIYDGKIGSGILFMVAYPICAILSVLAFIAALGGSLLGVLLTFSAPALWTWSVVSAYRTAERINLQTEWR